MKKAAIKTEVAILGAGLAGLTAAYHLKKDYLIFEKSDEAGGLCKSRRVGNFIFDCDGHLFHFKRTDIKRFVEDILGDELIHHKRSSWIYSKGTYTRYPFQANTFGLPHSTVKECLLELIAARKKNSSKIPLHFEDWLIKTFGKGYAKHFLIPYNRKFWKHPLKKLTCEWLDGFIPVPSIEDSLEGALDDSTKLFGYNADFWYPKKKGAGAFSTALLKKLKGNKVHLNNGVIQVDIAKSLLILENGQKVKYKYLVSTLPLPELVKLSRSCNKTILSKSKKLKYTSIFNLNFGLKKPNITKKHWIYFPEKSFPFFRLGIFSNFSLYMSPKGTSSVYIEFSYKGQNPLTVREMMEKSKLALRRLGFIDSFSDIIAEDYNDIKYGYIIYDADHRKTSHFLKKYFVSNNIFSIGRYGSWKYFSMEDTIFQGKITAEEINAK